MDWPDHTDPLKCIESTPSNSFYLAPVTQTQVSTLFAGLKENKAPLNVPNKLIKLASGQLSASDLGNYRPIAVISPFSKVLKRLVYDQVVSYLEKKSLLFNFQYGFRKEYSTEYAILETVEKLKSAVDDQQITCSIFLDFSKAFDTINHHILLEKLYKYGIRGLPHAWFTDYITNRKQYVKVGNAESS